MARWCDIGVDSDAIVGKGIDMEELFDVRIVIERVKVAPTKYPGKNQSGNRMQMQVVLAEFNQEPDDDGDYFVKDADGRPKGGRRSCFTGSDSLMRQSQLVKAGLCRLSRNPEKCPRSFLWTPLYPKSANVSCLPKGNRQMEYIPEIINAIGAIVLAWFTYNQYAKNKLTDLKIEQMRVEQNEKQKRRSDNSALVYGELWDVLHELNADRVYIVQPHPLGNESMVSVFFESKRKGVESMKPHIQNLKMADFAKFCADLSQNLFMFITDIDGQVSDRYAKSLLSSCGTNMVIVKRLSDNQHDWVGSIFCEFTHDMEVEETEARRILHEAAMNIQYILPEYRQ